MASSATKNRDSDSRDNLLDQAIVEYMQACEAGAPPETKTFLKKYSRVADTLKEFLGQQSQLNRMMTPLRRFNELVSSKNQKFPIEFGDHELIREVGRGGMGVIYEARQKDLSRSVALKMIRESQFASEADLARFRAEAEAAAALDHRNIVPIYGVGQVDDRPYFTMKLVNGGSLKEALALGKFQPRRAAAIALAIARAVNYAHQRGILHRDLKPANILLDQLNDSHSDNSSSVGSGTTATDTVVSHFDSSSVSSGSWISSVDVNALASVVPMISDFGLAKKINEDHGLTISGAVLGTPSFMSPEQASGQTAVTTATDIYGVGAILYNMLAGKPPFTGSTPVEVTKKVLTQTPSSIRGSNSGIDLDLETICTKCLEKEASHRYLTAGELADDLQRYLNGQPIAARRTSSFEQLVKWSRRNKAMASLFSAIAALLSIVFVGSLVFSYRLNAEAAKLAVVNTDLELQENETKRQRDNAVRRLFEAKFAEVAARRASGESGQRFKALAAAREAVKQLTFVDATEEELFELRSETAGCLGLADIEEVASWEAPVYGDYILAFSPSLDRFAHQVRKGDKVKVYMTSDLSIAGTIENQSAVAEIDVGPEKLSGTFRFSNCGNFLAVTNRTDNQSFLTVFNFKLGKTVFQESGYMSGCIGKVEGKDLLFVSGHRQVDVYDLSNMNQLTSYPVQKIPSVWNSELSPDGRWLSLHGRGGVTVVEALTGKLVWRKTGFTSWDIAWHPFEPKIATLSLTEVKIWKIGEDEPVMKLPKHVNQVFLVEYSPDGSLLVTSTWARTSKLWDTKTGEQVFELAGVVKRFSRQGDRLAFCGMRSGICQIESKRFRKTVSMPDVEHFAAKPMSLAVHPNNRWAAIGTLKDVRLCDLETEQRLVDLPGTGSAKFHPDGKSLLVCNEFIYRWPLSEKTDVDGRRIFSVGPPQKVTKTKAIASQSEFDIDPSGRFLVRPIGNKCYIYDLVETDRPRQQIALSGGPRDVSACHAAKLIAFGNHHNRGARVYDGKTGELLHTVETPTHSRVRLSPDGSLLAVTFSDKAEIYDTSDWSMLYALDDPGYEVAWPASFSKDNKYLVFVLRNPIGTLIVEARTGKKLVRFPRTSGNTPRDAQPVLTSNGKLVRISQGNGIEVWDLAGIRGELSQLNLDWAQQPQDGSFTSTSSTENDGELIVDVDWGASRMKVLNRALERVRNYWGRNSERKTIEGWLADSPNDSGLWHALSEVQYRDRDIGPAIESLTRAIELHDESKDDPKTDLLHSRAKKFRKLNRVSDAIDDQLQIIETVGEDNQGLDATKLALAWDLVATDEYPTHIELAVQLARKASKDNEGVLSTKVLGAALFRKNEFQASVDELEKVLTYEKIEAVKAMTGIVYDAPNRDPRKVGLDSQAHVYGSKFLLAMAYDKLGQREKAIEYFKQESADFLRYRLRQASEVRKFVKLENEAATALELKSEMDAPLRWDAMDLTVGASWDVGHVVVQYAKSVNMFSNDDDETDAVDRDAKRTRRDGLSLFYTPRRNSSKLRITFDVAESGIYNGFIGLVHSHDYGRIKFELNGHPVGQEFDGYHRKVVYGGRARLEGVELRRGKNTLTISVVGKSYTSNGRFVGVEYLEFEPAE